MTNADRIRAAGFRATSPRIAFLDTLSASKYPLSIHDLAAMLKKIDRVTLYRIAQSFENAGLISRVDLRTGKTLYESSKEHHHHIVCTDCGIIEDVDVCLPPKISEAVTGKSREFSRIRSHSLEFFGTCEKCA